jgi:hypothetical protein
MAIRLTLWITGLPPLGYLGYGYFREGVPIPPEGDIH